MTTIAIDIRVLGTGRASGVEEYTERLLEQLMTLDRSLQFKLFYASRTPLVRRSWMSAPNVSLYELKRSSRLLAAMTRLAGRPYLDQLVGGADVFFSPHFLDGAVSPTCRRVVTFHDLSFERFHEFFSLSRWLWHRVQMRPRRQAQRADRVLASSESTRQDLIKLYGLPPEKVSLIHLGVDSSLHRASLGEIEALRRQHNLPARFVLALGTREPRKNLEALVAAMAGLPRELAEVGLVAPGNSKLIWVGEIPSEQRAAWLSAASLLAYPSLFEGFGLPPLEAMACGTPVLVGANSSMLEVCGGAALAVQPYSINQIRAGLIAILTDQPLREKLIKRGLERAQSFPWRQTAEQTLAAILSTLSSPASPVQ